MSLSKCHINVTFNLTLNVTLKCHINVTFNLTLNVTLKCHINVTFIYRIYISCHLKNVTFKMSHFKMSHFISLYITLKYHFSVISDICFKMSL